MTWLMGCSWREQSQSDSFQPVLLHMASGITPSPARQLLWAWSLEPLLGPAPLTQMHGHIPPSKAFTFRSKNYLLIFTKP